MLSGWPGNLEAAGEGEGEGEGGGRGAAAAFAPVCAIAPVPPREDGDDAILQSRCYLAAALEQAQAQHLRLHVVAHGQQLAAAQAVNAQHAVAAAA